jgi:hypothetical protein
MEDTMEKFLGKYSEYLYARMRIIVGLLFACNEPASSLVSLAAWAARARPLPFFSQMGLAGSSNFLVSSSSQQGSSRATARQRGVAVAYFQNHFRKISGLF